MSDNPLYAELDRLRTELAANKRVTARLEEQRAKAEERVREPEAEMAAMRQALEKIAHPIAWLQTEAARNGLKLDGLMVNIIVASPSWYQECANKALATDAGKALLERMAKQEKALRAWRAWCLDERHSVADDTQLFEAAIELMDDALGTKEAQDAGAD